MDNKIPHILIVDDDVNLLATMSDILKLKGFDPFIAQTGVMALAQIEEHSFDLALIDLRLGDMSGLKVLTAIKARSPETECILLTGHASQDTAIEAIQMGVYGYFQKPFEMEQVLLSIQRALEKSAAAKTLQESEKRYRGLFEDSPIPLREEDFSEVKQYLDLLKQQGVTDFQKYFTLHPEIVFECAAKVKIVDVNKAALKMYRAEIKNILLINLVDILHNKAVEHFSDQLANIAGGQIEFSWEGIDHTVDGQQIDVAVNWSVAAGYEKDLSKVIVSIQDITERKQAEEALAESESKLRALVEQVPAIVYTESAKTRETLYISPQVEKITGYAPAEWVKDRDTWKKMIHPQDLNALLAVDERANENLEPFYNEYRILTRDGRTRWIHDEAVVIQNQNGTPLFWHGVMYDITERKQVEGALLESEAKFRMLVEHLPTVVYINMVGDANSTFYISPQIKELMGYTPQEWLADPKLWSKTLHPEDRQDVLTQTAHTDQSNEPFDMEYRMIARDGRLVWVRDQVVLVNDLEGQPQYWQGIMLDITERKQAEEAALESEERFRVIFEKANDAIHIDNADDQIMAVNSRMCELTGYSREELLKMHVVDLQAPEIRQPRNVVKNELALHGNTIFETLNLHRDGRRIPVEISIGTIELPAGDLYISVVRDITERKQAEKFIRESEKRYRAIFDGVQDAIFVETKDGRILEVNSRACEIYGYTRDEFLEKTVSDLVPEGSNVLSPSVVQPGILFLPLETINRRANGELFPVEINGGMQAINDEDVLLVIVRDITERKQAEETLRQRENLLNKIFDVLPVGLWLADKNGKLIRSNQRGREIWGAEPLVGQEQYGVFKARHLPSGEELSPDNWALVHTIREGVTVLDEMLEIEAFDGQKKVILNYTAPIFNETGKIDGAVIVNLDITGRKQAEEALNASRDLLRSVLENAPIRVFWKDAELRFLGCNLAFARDAGMSRSEDLIGKDDFQMAWSEQAEQYRADDKLVMDSDMPKLGFEEAHTILDGHINWVRTSKVPMHDAKGRVFGLLGIYEDITERKQAEMALRESEALYRQAIEVAGAVPYLQSYNSKGTDLHYDFIGEGIRHITGYGAEEFNGTLWDSLIQESIPQGDLADYSLEEAVRRVRSGAISLWKCEHRIRARDGEIHWVFEAAVELYAENGVAKGSIGMFQDITERKQAEENIRQHVKELELLYESGLVFSQLLNPREIAQKTIKLLGEKLGWHHTTIRLIRAQDELELVAFDQPGLRDKAAAQAVEAHLNKLITRVGEGLSGWALQQSKTLRIGDVGSDPHYIESYPGIQSGLYVPLKSNNRVLGVISIESEQPNTFSEEDEQLIATLANQAANAFENARLYQTAQLEIIERKRVENLLADEKNQLARRVEERTSDLSRVNADLAHAVRVKDEFLASMSHELRTPLTGILGLSEVLQLKIYGELNDKQSKTLKNIEESGRHLLDLINDILDLSKIEAGKLELEFAAYSLGDICQASLQLIKGMAQHKRQHLNYSPPTEPIIVRADARRLKQVLVNLLSNAIKFTPENGELGLDVEANQPERKIKLTVWDKGIGIKPEDLSKLFKPFTQLDSGLAREYSGTGLGLSLVQHLTELHNGGIEVESNFGKGSRFTIILPWSPQETTPIPYAFHRGNTGQLSSSTVALERSKAPLVMYVDDNEMVLQMVADFLESEQYRVIKVRSGLELLERAAEYHPNIMLVDIQMPGIGGMETIRRIRAHPDPRVAAAPVIAVTALAMPADRERCLRAGANDYMSKPLKLKQLAIAIQKLLERKQ